MMSKTKKALKGYLLIAPLMAGCILFYAFPFLLVIRYSFTSGTGDAMVFTGINNYLEIMKSDTFRQAFGNSLRFLAVGLPLIMALAYLTALLMQKQADKHKLLKSVFLFPYVMPVAGTVLLVDVIFAETGLWNRIVAAMGIPVSDLLSGPMAFWIVVLLYLWKNMGYSAILLLAGLITIPGEQYESADLDGASAWQKFRYITTPQMWYSVFFALVFSVINAFKCFREILLIGGRHPNADLYMLQHFLNNSFENMNYAKLSVASILLLLVVLVFFAFFYRFVKKKEVSL